MIPLRTEQRTKTVPYINWILVLLNLGVFVHQIRPGTDLLAFMDEYASIPNRIWQGLDPKDYGYFYPYRTLLTSMFLHGGFVHLFGNLLPLWVFGNHVEDRLGHWRYLMFYLFCGLAASVGQVFSDPLSTMPCVGASGAIAGILGASLLLIPKAWVVTLVPFFFIFRFMRIPAFVFLILWFGIQLFMSYTRTYGDLNIAFAAHIVGFLFGFFSILMIQSGRRI